MKTAKSRPQPRCRSLPNRRAEIWRLISKIPSGQVATYKAIAQNLNSPTSPRAVGQILKTNPRPLIIPCHRVVSGNGRPGGYFGKRTTAKIKLLRQEGIVIKDGIIDLERYFFSPKKDGAKAKRYLQ